MCTNSDHVLKHMRSCRILHNAHIPCHQLKAISNHFKPLNKAHNYQSGKLFMCAFHSLHRKPYSPFQDPSLAKFPGQLMSTIMTRDRVGQWQPKMATTVQEEGMHGLVGSAQTCWKLVGHWQQLNTRGEEAHEKRKSARCCQCNNN